MSRKFDIQLKSWIPLVIEAYYTYDTLNTYEIIKHSGRPLVILGAEGQVGEIISVLNFLVKSKFLKSTKTTQAHYFGVDFENNAYEVSSGFLNLMEKSRQRAEDANQDDLITRVKVENVTNNTVNNYNFNLTFMLEKLIEIKASLLGF